MADKIHLRDGDRLPWLETVERDPERRHGPARWLALLLLGLALVAAVLVAVLLAGGPATQASGGAGTLIKPQDGEYKIKPDDPGGMHVQGEGDVAVATSTGAPPPPARIDPRQVAEKPVAGHHAGSAAPQGGAIAAVPPPGGKLAPAAPATAPRAASGSTSGGSLVQLGAFPTEAIANAAWSALSKRFSYIAALGKSVQPADVRGRKIFRLRINAGSAGAAADICGKLKVAGEHCFVAA